MSMIKKICTYALMPLLALFIISTITVKDFLEFSLGKGETNFIYFTILITGGIFAFYAKNAIGIFILFISLIFLILGYSSFPNRQYERAKLHYEEFKNSHLPSATNAEPPPVVTNYVSREQQARKLEFEALELRYYGPKEYYGMKPWQYILFFSAILAMIAYGIFWIIVESKEANSSAIFKRQ